MTATCPKSLAKPPVSYVDSTLAKGVEAATEKQMKLAKWMSNELNEDLPVECSKANVRDFIFVHMDKFKAQVASKRSARASIYMYDGPYDMM